MQKERPSVGVSESPLWPLALRRSLLSSASKPFIRSPFRNKNNHCLRVGPMRNAQAPQIIPLYVSSLKWGAQLLCKPMPAGFGVVNIIIVVVVVFLVGVVVARCACSSRL